MRRPTPLSSLPGQHLGHAAVIGLYQRPIADYDEMDQTTIEVETAVV